MFSAFNQYLIKQRSFWRALMFQDALLEETVEGLERKVSQSFGNDQRSAVHLRLLCPRPSLHPHPLYPHPWRDERRMFFSEAEWFLWLLSISRSCCSDPLLNLVLLCPLPSYYANIQTGDLSLSVSISALRVSHSIKPHGKM